MCWNLVTKTLNGIIYRCWEIIYASSETQHFYVHSILLYFFGNYRRNLEFKPLCDFITVEVHQIWEMEWKNSIIIYLFSVFPNFQALRITEMEKCLDSIKGSFTNIFSPYSYIKHQIFDKYSHLTEKLYYTAFCRFCCALAEIKSNKIISRLFYILTLFIFSVFY